MKNFITHPGLMDSHLTIIGGMIGGWELLVILAVLGMMILVVGGLIVFGIMMLRKSKPVPPSTPPPIPTTPAPDTTVRVCRSCGTRQPPDAPLGLCPQCLMKAGLKSDAGASKTSRTDVPPLAPTEIAAHFPQLEILEILGQGGMGTVYKARQPHLDRFVALKILSAELSRDPAFAERFQREAKALARLNHPNIVSVFDFGQAGPHYFFVMEYVDGVNLAQLEHSRRLLPAEAMSLVPKICDALQYAHDEGVVHRDIKPGNILMDRKGRVKIADFGLAKLIGVEMRDFTLTATGMVMGTPRYMAPEQMERPAEVDHRADIYSLGVVFYEMLTGELPMGRFAPPSQKVEIDVRVDEVVLRSLERDVHRRYQKAGDVKTDVESITDLKPRAPAIQPGPSEPDFLLCHPGLPKMAQLICVFALIANPLLWLFSSLYALYELSHGPNFEFVDAATMTMEQAVQLRAFWGRMWYDAISLGVSLVAGAVLFLGALKLRRAVTSGVRQTLFGLAAQLLLLPAMMVVAALLPTETGTEAAAISFAEMSLLFIGLVAYAFVILTTVWLWRNRARVTQAIIAIQGHRPADAPVRSVSAKGLANGWVFWPLATGVLLLGWLVPAALWNFGRGGCVAALIFLAGLFVAVACGRVKTASALAPAWSKLSRSRRAYNLAEAGICALAGCFFLWSALATRWETRPQNWNSAGRSSHNFAAAHKGQEYKLMRQLSLFQNEVPQAELLHRGGSWTAGWDLGGIMGRQRPHNGMFTGISAAAHLSVAIFCFLGAAGIVTGTGRWRDTVATGKLTARALMLPLTLSALLAGGGVYAILCQAQVWSRAGGTRWITVPSLRLKASPDQVMAAFQTWCAREGFATGDRPLWQLNSVPKGDKLADVQLGQGWKPSFFERWRMTWHGPEQLTPHIVVQTVSTKEPLETVAVISVGWPPKNPELRKAWQAQLESLSTALKSAQAKAADTTSKAQP